MKKIGKIGSLIAILALSFVIVGCQKENTKIDEKGPVDNSLNNEFVYTQEDVEEPIELDIPENGVVNLEVENLAKPDTTVPEKKSFFLTIVAKEDTDISVQYTYNTYGKEGAVFCCDLKENDETEIKLKPISSTYLPQFSEKNYKEIWITNGMFLKKGENLFYLNGKDQTFPYLMTLKITFFEVEKIEKAILYPAEV